MLCPPDGQVDESCFLLGRGQAVQQLHEGHLCYGHLGSGGIRFPARAVVADFLPLDDDGVVILLGEAENVVVAEAYLLAELIGDGDPTTLAHDTVDGITHSNSSPM